MMEHHTAISHPGSGSGEIIGFETFITHICVSEWQYMPISNIHQHTVYGCEILHQLISDLPHYLQVFYHSGAGFLTPTVFKLLIRQRAPPLHITMPVIQPFQSHQAIHTRFFASLPHITGNVQWMYAFTKFHVVTMIAFHTHAFLNVPLFWRI